MTYLFRNSRRLRRPMYNSPRCMISVPCCTCVHTDLENAATAFSILGKAAITISFSGVYVYTTELVPTNVRNIGIGTASMCARIAGMAAPYVGGPLVGRS